MFTEEKKNSQIFQDSNHLLPKSELEVSNIIKIPIILSGGCGVAKHFIEGFSQTKAMGISAGSYFANRDQNIFQLIFYIYCTLFY